MPALPAGKHDAPDWIGFGFSAKPERGNLLTHQMPLLPL